MKRTLCWMLILGLIISVGMFGCAKKEKKEIKIGAILILTGQDANAGQNARKGIEMAIDEINEGGGIKGRKIRVIYEDDQGEPQKAITAIKKLINIDNVPIVIGPMWSTSVLAISPIAENSKIVVLSPTASAPKISNAGDFIFRNTYSDVFEGSKDAEYAYKELGYRKAGVIHVNIDAGAEIANVFSKKFKELGGEVILTDSYEPKTSDFRSLLTKFKQKPIDFIYLMGYSEMGQLVKQAREIGVKVPFVSTIMFEISDVVKVAKEASEGTVYSYPSYDPEKGGDIVSKFAQRFKERYGILPDPEAAFSYDAAKIICQVILDVGTQPFKIKEGLYKIRGFNGVTGITTFDENGDVIKSIGFKEVKDGKYVWRIFEY